MGDCRRPSVGGERTNGTGGQGAESDASDKDEPRRGQAGREPPSHHDTTRHCVEPRGLEVCDSETGAVVSELCRCLAATHSREGWAAPFLADLCAGTSEWCWSLRTIHDFCTCPILRPHTGLQKTQRYGIGGVRWDRMFHAFAPERMHGCLLPDRLGRGHRVGSGHHDWA